MKIKPFQPGDVPGLTISSVGVRHGPCGHCETLTPRDDLVGFNVSMFAKDGSRDVETKYRLRLCPSCAAEYKEELDECQWDNASMVVIP